MRKPLVFFLFVAAVLVGFRPSGIAAASARSLASNSPSPDWIVSPGSPITTIAAALAAAEDGDVIEVRGGTYPALVVDKSVTLEGVDRPVIDGGGEGTVVALLAPGITFRGFDVTGSGDRPDKDHAGITLEAAGITVEDNHLTEVLFGVFVAGADHAVVRGNEIGGMAAFEIARKGDGIRLWNSRYALVENNHVHEGRDVVMWYSSDVTLRGNTIERGRYGVHLMYCDNALIEQNHFLDNTVGIYTMYSGGILIRENEVRGHHGTSGYALGFKDAGDVEVADNLLVDNHAGAFLDGLAATAESFARFHGNIFAFNNIGVMLMPAVNGVEFTGNTFWENVEQMAIQGGGGGANDWHGNFWSDYTGFDAGGSADGTPDGVGDIPYRSERLFENMTDRTPNLRALIYSPASQAIEMAASSFPVVRPQPKLEDRAPLMAPAGLPALASNPASDPGPMALAALAVTAFGGICGLLAYPRQKKHFGSPMTEPTKPPSAASALMSVHSVTKRYRKVAALENVSFELSPGEALALWGANGAGKTTLIKAALGLIDFEGEIRIGGRDVGRAGKQARRLIGYVPQEFAFYDLSVRETLAFYARLKKTSPARIPVLLGRLGLDAHVAKAVGALSGGLRQRLALAVALLDDPPLLLLDEPLANLDARARRDYLALLATLRREGKTILFASHRIEEVETLADRVLVLEDGRAAGLLTPEELRARFQAEVDLTLWIPENRRAEALACLEAEGYQPHLNGRGTLVVRVPETQKIHPLTRLSASAIPVLNFELEGA